MDKLKEFTKKIKDKWSTLTKGKKITFTIIPIGIICAIIVLVITMNSQKYGVLFSNMNDKDLGAILTKLKEKKVEYKVEGKAIKVPKDKVDVLRLELASEVPLTNGSVGFEIFDESKFGATDEEMKIKYQRALEGELERTIKGLPEVDDAKVHLVMSEDSVFVKQDTPSSASLTLRLKSGKELKKEQVKAIVALLCGSVKNLDKKNVEVIAAGEYGTALLTTPDLFNEEDKEYIGNTQEQEKMKNSLEKSLESKIQSMLEKVYGKNNIVVKVNADLNFDAIQQNSTEFAPKGTVVSEHIIQDSNNNADTANTNSPVDDNMAAREETTKGNSNVTHKEEKRNYEISKSEKKIIKAPGAVNKLSTSVLLNGNIDTMTKSSITNLVTGTIGYDEKRGDTISVEGMNFDKSLENKAKKDIEAMEKLKEKERLNKIIMYSVMGVILLITLIIVLIVRNRKKRKEEELEEEVNGIDVVIGDNVQPKEAFESINFEEDNEKTHLEREIQNYATEKPEQVAEIVKSWLTEDER